MLALEVDKGWSWMVCVGTFIAMFLTTGIVKALGVLLPVLRQQFTTKTWIIGLMISLVPGFGAVTCLLAGVLSKRFTARFTVMLFGCLAALGLICGFVSTTISGLTFCFILTSFLFGAEAILLGELASYFDQNYRVANSLGQMGLSSGIIVMPLLTQFFSDTFGWSGTMLLLGAISTHFFISGAVLRPVNGAKEGKHNSNTGPSQPSTTENGKCILSLLYKVVYYLDLILFQDINFVSMVWYQIANGYCLTGWVVYLVPYAIDIGITPYKAAVLATFGGVGNLIGNAIYLSMTKRYDVTKVLSTFTLVSFVALAVHPILSQYKSYVGLVLSSAAFGCGRGIAVLCVYQVVKETTDKESRTNAMMWTTVAFSVGSIASGFLSGWMYDQTESFAVSFFILSAFALLSVALRVIIDLISKYKEHGYITIR